MQSYARQGNQVHVLLDPVAPHEHFPLLSRIRPQRTNMVCLCERCCPRVLRVPEVVWLPTVLTPLSLPFPPLPLPPESRPRFISVGRILALRSLLEPVTGFRAASLLEKP